MNNVIGGRYEIDTTEAGILGKGGMGTVFKGWDSRMDTVVAIKQLKPEIVQDDPGIVERFMREGEALRRLNHPNIVKVLDTVEAEGYHYIIMEYVAGGSLRDLLTEQGQLPVEQVLHIALELADALSRAHHLRIIHRDIKPANVLLAEDGTPRLTDFGIARLDDKSRVTETGSLMGTFSYLSPEACSGEELDARTDIWSFGVMLHEMLSGIRPFEEDQIAATITSILTKEPPYIADIRRDTPEALANLIHRMLEKDRDKRPGSTRSVGAELEAILHGKDIPTQTYESRFETPTSADPPTVIVKGRSVSRNWRSYAVAGILILAVIGIVAVLLGGQNATPEGSSTNVTASVEPADADEYMVLVAQIENVGGAERDVTRFIVDDLKQRLEVEVSFSNVRVREYDSIITSEEEAIEIAELNGASVIAWGNYNDARVQLDVQVGSLAAFPYNLFERDIIERTANVRVLMTDELSETIAPQVLGVLSVLHTADGNYLELVSAISAIDLVNMNAAQLTGDTIASNAHTFLSNYLAEDQRAIDAISKAIEKDVGNPLLYALRSMAWYRQAAIVETLEVGDSTNAVASGDRDLQTAQDVEPTNWTLPLFIDTQQHGNLIEIAMANSEQLIELRPDDWYAFYVHGISFFARRETTSLSSINQAVELRPDNALPYAFSAIAHMNTGQLKEAAKIVDVALSRISDSSLTLLANDMRFGYPAADRIQAAVFAHLVLGQPEVATTIAPELLDSPQGLLVDDNPTVIVVWGTRLLDGTANCQLGNYNAAFNEYSALIRWHQEFGIAHLLRIDAKLKLGWNVTDDIEAIRRVQGNILAPYVYGVQQGILGCENIFDLEALQAAEEAYAASLEMTAEP